MYIIVLVKNSWALLLVFWLCACSNQEPYIFNADEFNRNSPNFAKELKNRSKLEICYDKWSTTPAILAQMAKDECGRFGKVAHFIKSEYLGCSISSPAQAVYWCLCPGETVQSRSKKNLNQSKEKQDCSKFQ